jgi:hypothetical protein
VIFIPLDACDDGGQAPSSFGQAVQIFRARAGREKPVDDPTLFERVLIGLYDVEVEFGRVGFFDVMDPPPRNGRPRRLLSFEECVQVIIDTYDSRNKAVFRWADAAPEVIEAQTLEDETDED